MTSSIRAPATSIKPSNQSCFPPIITLIPSTSSLSSPLQFRRSQDFSISSYLQLDCNSSLSTNTKWTITNCTSTCFFQIQMDQTVITTSSEIFIPAKTLAYAIYQLTLTANMVAAPHLSSSASAYVEIAPSDITANLVQFGTSMITRGYQQALLLDPGTFSVDPDTTTFNASNWIYEYYCRIYGLYNFPNVQGTLLTIDDPRIDSLNPSCLSNRSGNGTALQYSGTNNSLKSSLTILPNSLKSNQTYQFMVSLTSRQNSTLQVTGYLLVQVEDTQTQLIVIACVISTLCAPNLEYQFVNPTTQVALFSICVGNFTSIDNITWNVYQGVMNSTSNIVQWTRFNQMNQYQNNWFFGSNTSNFTSTNNLFISNSFIEYWRFEVIYSFPTEISSSALNFRINQPPQNGSCSINPLNGTTSTLFTISCSNWQDQDGIQDYSVYLWTTNPAERMIVAFSSIPTTQVRLPAGNDNTSFINLIVYIRDTLDGITEYNLSSPSVVPDTVEINNLINNLQISTNAANNNPIVQLLSSGNQNIVGQIIISLSQIFNRMNTEILENTISNGVPATSISISSLGQQSSQSISIPLNTSALIQFNKQLNIQANIRDYLISFITNLIITTPNSIKLQASSLAQLTQATNQLTRTTSLLASNKCYQLAFALYSVAIQIPYEDVLIAATQITQCTNNIISAINGPLQQRTNVLDLDLSRANTMPQDYDTDLESEWSNLNLFANGDDFSWETIEKGRNTYYQKQAANQISDEITKTISLVTSALNIHLNIGQNMLINSSSVFMSLETTSMELLPNKLIQQIENAHIRIPSNLITNSSDNGTVSLRSIIQPLASASQSQSVIITNLSRSISFSILDQNGRELSIQTTRNQSIELIIPRDPNLVIPAMNLQNVTSLNSTPHSQLFNLQFVNITNPLAISVHFEILPLNTNLGYLFIYKFDNSPILNSSMNQIDGWTLFCPLNLTNDSIYTYFIDNQKTVGHQSVIFGLRELNSTEIIDVCSSSSVINLPITNEPFNFTSNYELRIYTSGCYYLDTNNNWQSDGLLVGPLTNHYQTQCFSTHLTTFTGGFLVLPAPINWNYVFSNDDFTKTKTIYIVLIYVCILHILLIIYARYKDKKDVEKLDITSLPDNHKSDQYFYQLIVFTSHRKDAAGTKSKVHCLLSVDDDALVRIFDDSQRNILQRGGIDAFLLPVPKLLGILLFEIYKQWKNLILFVKSG